MTEMFGSREFLAYFLNIAAEAEASDDGVFQDICEVVPRELRDGLLVHAEDEERHAVLLRECVRRNGGEPGPVPPELQLFNLLLAEAGITDPSENLMEFFLLLKVAEERASAQYAAIAGALESVDPQSAAVLRSIARDEAAHIIHCHKLASLFAPDEDAMASALAGMRDIETKVFKAFASAVFSSSPCQP